MRTPEFFRVGGRSSAASLLALAAFVAMLLMLGMPAMHAGSAAVSSSAGASASTGSATISTQQGNPVEHVAAPCAHCAMDDAAFTAGCLTATVLVLFLLLPMARGAWCRPLMRAGPSRLAGIRDAVPALSIHFLCINRC